MSVPDEIEYFYSSDEVGLEVHHREFESAYWIFAGQGAIQVREEDFTELARLLCAYSQERLEKRPRMVGVLRWFSGLLLLVLVGLFVTLLIQGVMM